MARIVCPRCGKYGEFKQWKDGHNGRGYMVYHTKRSTGSNRCYIDPITSININSDIRIDHQLQQTLF